MITEDQLIHLFLDACPSLLPGFDERQVNEWDGELYPCLELSRFSDDFVKMQRQNKAQELDAGFALLERLYVEGNEEMHKMVNWCFLEDFVFSIRECRIDSEVYAPYVRPATRVHWEEMKRYWPAEAFVGDPKTDSCI